MPRHVEGRWVYVDKDRGGAALADRVVRCAKGVADRADFVVRANVDGP